LYSALYRRLRPKRFEDIIGQPHIVRTLRNQIMKGKASHAYLFNGTRGTGKTTSALVFAKAINCETPENGEPCLTCAACDAIGRGAGFNVIEIDAASNNGVDNIRDIREEVKYPPAHGKYKVYIIDEAHMLSTSAFNALLKTLEEPPKGVIFILATTDPQKIPATVHSRCQRFDFKRISSEVMSAAITGYLKDEGIEAGSEAVSYVTRISDGSMRDALSILDQCAAFYMDEEITIEKIMSITGAAGNEVSSALLTALSENNAPECIQIIDTVTKNGKDIHQFTNEFITFLRDSLIVLTTGNNAAKILDLSADNINKLKEGIKNISTTSLARCIAKFSELQQRMRFATTPRILFEITCVNICRGDRPRSPEPPTAPPNPTSQNYGINICNGDRPRSPEPPTAPPNPMTQIYDILNKK